jgi:hypothetical protein
MVGKIRHNTLKRTVSLTAALLLCAAPAVAQDATSDTEPFQPESPGLSLNVGTQTSIDRIGAINVPRLDLPVEAVGSTLFKLDLSDTACLTGRGRATAGPLSHCHLVCRARSRRKKTTGLIWSCVRVPVSNLTKKAQALLWLARW